ncbi:uncharacterized protein BO87DRAFT_420456 [Aspergillus neoniger CBS 115656]|uniref:Uncharacterized protein n=1 Tax=Aspergillus neoniger (strain CBS 115656) TaxID=1448310 RepID=A0A318Y4E4_ASPNB|nr:hypothetical protein BO87DRAFT_420456 [Aspergillus neoniger CBS 115656]PYH28317.1 hypothetical protein BO87DRAFT_420456 [Aspergillus neoniger CBS 115656]
MCKYTRLLYKSDPESAQDPCWVSLRGKAIYFVAIAGNPKLTGCYLDLIDTLMFSSHQGGEFTVEFRARGVNYAASSRDIPQLSGYTENVEGIPAASPFSSPFDKKGYDFIVFIGSKHRQDKQHIAQPLLLFAELSKAEYFRESYNLQPYHATTTLPMAFYQMGSSVAKLLST